MNNSAIPSVARRFSPEEIPFWNDLTAAEQATVREHSEVRIFPEGSQIYGGDSSCLGMITLLRGGIRVYILSEEGREITLFRIGAGESCVLSASCVIAGLHFEVHMVTMEETEIFLIPSSVFSRLSESNVSVRCFQFERTTERLSSVIRVMEDILFTPFDRRLATFLRREFEKNGSTELRLTQEAIAVEVNSAREVVARTLRRFAGEGIIESGRGVIRLKDAEALKSLSD